MYELKLDVGLEIVGGNTQYKKYPIQVIGENVNSEILDEYTAGSVVNNDFEDWKTVRYFSAKPFSVEYEVVDEGTEKYIAHSVKEGN